MTKRVQDLNRGELEERARAQQEEIDELKGRNEKLTAQVAQLTTHVEQLTRQVDRLQHELSRAGKDSATSVKPSSSDKQKKPCSPSGSNRKKRRPAGT